MLMTAPPGTNRWVFPRGGNYGALTGSGSRFRRVAQQDRAAWKGAVLQQSQRDP